MLPPLLMTTVPHRVFETVHIVLSTHFWYVHEFAVEGHPSQTCSYYYLVTSASNLDARRSSVWYVQTMATGTAWHTRLLPWSQLRRSLQVSIVVLLSTFDLRASCLAAQRRNCEFSLNADIDSVLNVALISA